MNFLGNSKKNLIKEVKKRLNVRLECHLTGPHVLPHKVTVYIYIYIDD